MEDIRAVEYWPSADEIEVPSADAGPFLKAALNAALKRYSTRTRAD